MPRTLPLLALIAVVAFAGCTGGLGLGGSSDDPTTTTTATSTETTQTATSTASATTAETTTTTTTATQPTQTATTQATTEKTTQQPTQTTTMWARTTARVDAPTGSNRFEARVTTTVDPTTIKIKRNGKTQTVDLLGVQVPKNGSVHKRALQTTKAQLQHGVVTVATDPKANRTDSDGHLQAYVYTGDWLYNTQLLQSGYARVSDTQFSKRQQFRQKQRQARQGGYGLWNTTTAN